MKTDAEWQKFVDKAIERAFARTSQRLDKKIAEAAEDAAGFYYKKFKDDFARVEERLDIKATKVAEDAAGFYYEKMKDDFARTNEATDFIKERLEQQIDREEFDDLVTDDSLNRLAIMETNKDVGKLKFG